MSVTVLIPFTETSSNLSACLLSLLAHAADCSVYVVDGSGGNLPLQLPPSVQYLRPDEPLDFRALCRWGYTAMAVTDSDLLILDPAVEIGPGVLAELTAVLQSYERHAIAVPRSNRAGIQAIPLLGPELSPDAAYSLWEILRDRLPRYQILPPENLFCPLIRGQALRHFGFLRPGEDIQAYSSRINQYGYSTVLANRAFARLFTPGLPAEDLRQYLDLTADPVDYFGALAVPHRPRILFDLHHLAPRYNGTADFALNLLRALRTLAKDDFDILVDIQPASLEFFLPELHGYPLYQPDSRPPHLFDLVFKPTQINSWDELDRINRLAPRVTYTILDMIAVRCSYLSYPGKGLLFRKSAELCDHVFTISHSVSSDFRSFTGSAVPPEVIYLGTSYSDSAREYLPGSYVLLMGNSYPHKALPEALEALKGLEYPIVVLGMTAPSGTAYPNVRYLASGALSRETVRETIAAARVVVYPSYYEGFGLPVLDALTLGKPVVVQDTSTNCELARLTRNDNLHRIAGLDRLKETVTRVWNSSPAEPGGMPRNWLATAQQYLARFRKLLREDLNVDRVRARWEFLRARQL